jgi:O-antigen/teichoic acid export membrane protein
MECPGRRPGGLRVAVTGRSSPLRPAPPDDPQGTVREEAARSVKWSASTEVVSKLVPPVVVVLLARLLSPEDFGLVSTAMIVISFSQMFWDAGLGRALIQTRLDPETSANVVFWTNAVLGLLMYTLVAGLAPWIAAFFANPDATPVLRVLGLQILLSSLSSVQQALFVRKLDFRQLFWIRLCSALVPPLLSIPLALLGHGVWALVAGSLAGAAVNVGLLWRFSPWRPRLSYDMARMRALFAFGVWAVGESAGAWFFVWGDSFLVARFLGVEELGVYWLGVTLSTMMFGLVLNPFLPVLYPTFSRLQDDMRAVRATFHQANRVLISLAFPLGIVLLFLAPELAVHLLGDRWLELGMVVGVIGLMHGLSWSVGLNAEVFRAMGRPDVNAKLLAVTICGYLPAYLLAVRHGLEPFVYTRLGVALLIGVPIQVAVCSRLLGLSPLYLWHQGRSIILSVVGMAGTVLSIRWVLTMAGWTEPAPLRAAVLGAAALTSYATCLWLLDRPFVKHVAALVRRSLAPT